MNAQTTFPEVQPFKPLAAYEAEAAAHRETYNKLRRATWLLRMALDGNGIQDKDAVRAFLAECAR